MRTSQIVAFLDSAGALDLEARSPWPGRVAAGEVVVPVRTGPLLRPSSATAPWTLPHETATAIVDALRAGGSPEPAPAAVRWDVDAWYRPVHLHAYDTGIHVREKAVLDLALQLAASSRVARAPLDATPANAEHLVRMAFLVLYLHQLFHHRVETLGIQLQVVEQKPRYVAYYRDAYSRAAGTDDQLEEALADAFVHRSLTRRTHCSDVPTAVRRIVADHVRSSWAADEPSYRDAARYLLPDPWARGLGELHARVDEATVRPARRATWRHLGPDLTGTFLDPDLDVAVVAEAGSPALLPHADATPTCSGPQMVALLERAGYEQPRRNRGPQVRLTCKGRAVAFVPPSSALPLTAVTRLLQLVDAVPDDLPALLRGA